MGCVKKRYLFPKHLSSSSGVSTFKSELLQMNYLSKIWSETKLLYVSYAYLTKTDQVNVPAINTCTKMKQQYYFSCSKPKELKSEQVKYVFPFLYGRKTAIHILRVWRHQLKLIYM